MANAATIRSVPDLVPVRMLNEFAYCPRLFFLEWVQGEWADNALTLDGSDAHRRVDRAGGELPEPGELEEGESYEARSLELSSDKLGLIAKIDLVRTCDGQQSVAPIDFKRGRPPSIPEGAWLPERLQVCAQALLLRDHGYACDEGFIYFVESKQRVSVPIGEALILELQHMLAALRETAARALPPPPLSDSPKCPGCSLHAICLPDEVNDLAEIIRPPRGSQLRRLHPARDDALPLYVTLQGARVGVRGERLHVSDRDRKRITQVRFKDTSQVCVFGGVQVSTDAVRRLCTRGIPLCYFSTGGWFYGRTESIAHKNVDLRIAQYGAIADEERSLTLAQRFVATKIRNCRTLLRRNAGKEAQPRLDELERLAAAAERTAPLASLLGVEGLAGRVYFGAFDQMLKPPTEEARRAFSLRPHGRSRRPPPDAVNALLSFAYSLLVKDWTVTLAAVGLDPYVGFLHRPRYGRPALALDLMEEFRPLVADSVVLSVISNGAVEPAGFDCTPFGVAMRARTRKALLRAYEHRLDQLIQHPVFGYRISYRRVLEVQARLFGRHLLGELPAYPEFRTR